MKEEKSKDLKNVKEKINNPPEIEEVNVDFEDNNNSGSPALCKTGEIKSEPEIPEEWKGKPESEIILLREIRDLKNKLNEMERIWFDKYARLQAEFENYQRRSCKDRDNYVKYASSELISKLLPTLDSIEIMLKSLEKRLDSKEFQGIQMIFKELFGVFEKEGLTPIKAQGCPFDPFMNEILMIEYTDKYPEDTVIEEIQKGYKLKDRVLRPSKVKIAKPKKEEAKNKEAEHEK